MSVPPEFQDAFMVELAQVLPGLINRAWAASQRAAKGLPAKAPRKAPSAGRVPKGAARKAILDIIKSRDEAGASRDDIRRAAPDWLKGRPISENTLKRVLMILREDTLIETKNSRWYRTDMPVRPVHDVRPLSLTTRPRGRDSDT